MFIDFLKAHYELICAGVLVLLSFVLTLVRKRPSINTIDLIKSAILEILPSFIRSVEQPGNGLIKKNLVLKLVQKFVAQEFRFYDFGSLEKWVSDQLENILSTPSKKED